MKTKTTSEKPNALFSAGDVASAIHSAVTLDMEGYLQSSSRSCTEGDHSDAAHYFCKKQVNELLKKFVDPGNDKDAKVLESLAIDEFVSNNNRLAAFRNGIVFPRELRCFTKNTPKLDRILLRARALCHTVLGNLDEDEWFNECRHSSGSSIGIKFAKTSLRTKMRLPMTASESSQVLFQRYVQWDGRLLCHFRGIPGKDDFIIVKGSKLTTVEKKDDERRVIAPEDTAGMFLQLGLMSVMFRRLKSFNLDVEWLQFKHTFLAFLSSIGGVFATIDWSKASDSVIIELVEFLFPSCWFHALYAVRAENTVYKGRVIRLNMMSTMGNATTFPVETLVFWSLASAVVSLREQDDNSTLIDPSVYERVSVFGDDCILPSEDAPIFMEVLSHLGFLPNLGKSHWRSDDKFRESCGGDYFAGRDVRIYNMGSPHNLKHSSLEPWLYTIMNGLLKKYIMFFGDQTYVYDKELWYTCAKLFRRYGLQLKIVPDDYPDDAGFKISEDAFRFRYGFQLSRIGKGQTLPPAKSKLIKLTHKVGSTKAGEIKGHDLPMYHDSGMYSFKYCTFEYQGHDDTLLGLEFWRKLKFPPVDVLSTYAVRTRTGWWKRFSFSVNQSEIVSFYSPSKRIGGYVVREGTSSRCTYQLKALIGRPKKS